ncbi:anhydro-N-acetylmuramic acid kinase [Zhongshania antarctica]|uniref:Anhydro-N-acetylmuramic acid kinase n=1 Tax=Zhongshania antarctica TaxID=641702 RepID=A0A840R5E5_9GAMM|nr:anhydro-N-acetylmuramic acid kinase [Zhongshania antarctica]MBB5187601.1 anhydro-N-acetylmuramic acid kinase [Zhongshania antarctica]
MSKHYYIGLMSGTSLDAIDATLISSDEDHIELVHSISSALPLAVKAQILELCDGTSKEIELLGRLDRELGSIFAQAALDLCQSAGISPSAIRAIGSHGQTVRHRPPDEQRASDIAFTLQIGDPNTIAEISGITTVADFRRRDIAAGGQGAPLVPAFHVAAFGQAGIERLIVNIGGMANISLLKADGKVIGFDTGPGNILMDSWIMHCQGHAFDRDGAWAQSGKLNQDLLETLLQDPYYAVHGPKSTGREQFNLVQLLNALESLPRIPPADVQATLLELTARSICDAIGRCSQKDSEVFICGGGSANHALFSRIQALLADRKVATTEALEIHPDWVEAAAFAWLAKQNIMGLAGNVPAVTGAKGPRILGAVYPG